MKLYTAMLGTETNSFSPMPTGYDQFAEMCLFRPGDAARGDEGFRRQIDVFARLGQARGWTVVEGLAAFAQPAGPTVRSVYEGFRDEIIAHLRQNLPVDAVCLSLHGAMIAEGYDDGEGDLIKHVRQVVGPNVPIGATLDPHAHLTQTMLDHATALIFFKEYPHTDTHERAADLLDLIGDAAAGRTKPVMSVFDCRQISVYHTNYGPMRAYVDQLAALEGQNNVLSISVVHGFPWGDTAATGTKTLVITDNQPAIGAKLAEQLGRELIALRGQTFNAHLSIDAAVDRALAAPRGPIVLADVSDNAGGGAPGDSTFLLRALLERGVENAAVACIWDPIVVQLAFAGGVGARFDARLGGKMGLTSGDPLDLPVEVRHLRRQATQSSPRGAPVALGDTAVLRSRGIDIVVNSLRTQTLGPDAFANHGVDPTTRRILVVKSSQHFRAQFEPIAAEILYVATPGAIPPDMTLIPYTKIRRPIWPLDHHPLAE